jgi:SAM-dependent methyltransferase
VPRDLVAVGVATRTADRRTKWCASLSPSRDVLTPRSRFAYVRRMTENWRAINLANWESRVPVHTGPDGYDRTSFDDPAHLSNVVRYDLPRLGRLDGLDVVHMQCHVGTDTISLARLGARTTVGVDFSQSALREARNLAARTGAAVMFVDCDAYDAVELLGAERFDLVYTGIGAICWPPSIRRWADVVAGLLRPRRHLFMREGHPVLWSICDPRPDGLLVVEYPYFETEGVLFREETTYAGTGIVNSPDIVSFNHGLGEIFTALQAAGMTMTSLQEHREVPWNPLGEAMVSSPGPPRRVPPRDPTRSPAADLHPAGRQGRIIAGAATSIMSSVWRGRPAACWP